MTFMEIRRLTVRQNDSKISNVGVRCEGVMGSWRMIWILFLMFALMPELLHGGVSVHFRSGRPLYVALGRTLVLEAEFHKNPDDLIDGVTWDRERRNENVRISGTAHDKRISFEKRDALLRITDVTESDFGTYKVTVTDSHGDQQHDSIEVRKIEKPPDASVLNVLECAVDKHDMAQWDTPQFVWLVDGVKVTQADALSPDGSRLRLSQVKGENYTCIISSSLGTVTKHYDAPKETPKMTKDHPCYRGLFALISVLALVAVLIIAGVIYMKKRKN